MSPISIKDPASRLLKIMGQK